MTAKALNRALPTLQPEQIATWLKVVKAAPVTQAAAVLEAVPGDRPRDFTSALLLADATLAQALGWSHVLPLLAFDLKRGDLRKTGEALRLTCHQAIETAAVETTQQAIDLTQRAARLKEAVLKLRARGSDEAVAHFLARDAIAPS